MLCAPVITLLVLLWGCSSPAEQIADARDEIAALTEAGALDEALAAARALQAERPDARDGHLLEAQLLVDRWQMEDSVGAFVRAYQVQPQGFPALAEMVYALGFAPRMTPAEASQRAIQLAEDHARDWPDEAAAVAEARVVGWTAALNLDRAEPRHVRRARLQLEAALADYQTHPRTTSPQRYHEAEALAILGRWPEAMAAMEAGIAAGTDRWEVLTMRMGLAFLQSHRAQTADAGWDQMVAYADEYAAWPGYHFAMRMPMMEFLQLTAAARYGRELPAPAALAGRASAAAAAGVGAQYGTVEQIATIQALLAARAAGDDAATTERLGDLQILVSRDWGCVTESRIVRPHLLSAIAVMRGDLLVAMDPEGAAARYAEAARFYPEDEWIRERVSGGD